MTYRRSPFSLPLFCVQIAASKLVFGIALLLGALSGSEAQAEKLSSSDWTLICETDLSRSDCRMEQSMTTTFGTTEVFRMTVWLGPTGIAEVKASIPREVYLVPGLEVQVMSGDKMTASFEFCDLQLCHASFSLSAPLLLAFKRGRFAKVRVWRTKSEHLDFPVSLHGFTAGLEHLGLVHR